MPGGDQIGLFQREPGRDFKVPLSSHPHFGVLTVLPGEQSPEMVMPVTRSDQG